MLIGKTFTFEAAHHLPNHDGKCRRPHGHSYKVDVCLIGMVQDSGPKEGMVLDFADLKRAFNERVFDRLDHQDMNTIFDWPTTAENLAGWMLGELADALKDHADVRLYSVTVWETASSYAEAQHPFDTPAVRA